MPEISKKERTECEQDEQADSKMNECEQGKKIRRGKILAAFNKHI